MLLYFLLLLLIPHSACILKMIKIFGKVGEGFNYGNIYEPYEDCVNSCYDTSDCILAYMNLEEECFHYSYLSGLKDLQVVETDPEEESFVAFKINLPTDTCPITFKNIDFTLTTVSNGTYSWNTTEDGWSFNGCKDGWKRFDRSDDVSVCIKAALIANSKKSMAQSECGKLGTVLVGVASVEESQWMSSEISRLPSRGNGFWIDGVRNCTNAPPKCNNFDWSDGFTTGNAAMTPDNAILSGVSGHNIKEDCLKVYASAKETLNDVTCDSTADGAFCGYRLF